VPRRDPRVDAILEAWYELHICGVVRSSTALIDAARKETSLTREEVKDALWNQFVELKRVKRREQWPRLPK